MLSRLARKRSENEILCSAGRGRGICKVATPFVRLVRSPRQLLFTGDYGAGSGPASTSNHGELVAGYRVSRRVSVTDPGRGVYTSAGVSGTHIPPVTANRVENNGNYTWLPAIVTVLASVHPRPWATDVQPTGSSRRTINRDARFGGTSPRLVRASPDFDRPRIACGWVPALPNHWPGQGPARRTKGCGVCRSPKQSPTPPSRGTQSASRPSRSHFPSRNLGPGSREVLNTYRASAVRLHPRMRRSVMGVDYCE